MKQPATKGAERGDHPPPLPPGADKGAELITPLWWLSEATRVAGELHRACGRLYGATAIGGSWPAGEKFAALVELHREIAGHIDRASKMQAAPTAPALTEVAEEWAP